jgi:hypothetical protein
MHIPRKECCDFYVEYQIERCDFGDVDTGFTRTILRPPEKGFFFTKLSIQNRLP